MTKRSFIPVVLLVAISATAIPAFAVPGEEARALGRQECQEFKLNFGDNKSQFGKCVAAVAKSLRQQGVSAREACGQSGLSRKPAEGEKRSDFSACVLAAKEANQQASS